LEIYIDKIKNDKSKLVDSIEDSLEINYGIKDIAIIYEKYKEADLPVHIEEVSLNLIPKIDNEHKEVNIDIKGAESDSPSNKKLAMYFGKEFNMDELDPKNLQEVLKRAALKTKDKGITFVYEDGKEEFLSYAELLENAEKLLAGLRSTGYQPGKSIIFQFRNNKYFIIAFWACILGGFIPTPLGIAPVYNENNAQVTKLYNTWKLLDEPIILTEDALEKDIRNIKTVMNSDAIVTYCIEKLICKEPDKNWFHCSEDDIILNLLTSGSTGIPKCVRHKSKSILSRTKSNIIDSQLTENEVSLNWMPLDHVGGIVMCHIRDTYLMCSQVNCLISEFINKPLNWLIWTEKYKSTYSWAPSFAFSLVNEYEKTIKGSTWDLSSLKYIINGGEAVNPNVARKFLQLLKPHKLVSNCIIPCFGMSEISSGVIESKKFNLESNQTGVLYVDKNSLGGELRFTYEGDPNAIVFTEVGRPIPGVGIRIVDDNNCCLPEDWIGRFQIAGPTVMNGYYKNKEANDESFVGDGWFDSGDLGFIHEGSLVITGRKKDVIIINGANYYNYEIEAVVEEIQGVETTFSCATNILSDEGKEALAVFFVPVIDDIEFNIITIQQIRQTVARKIGISPKVVVPVKKDAFFKTDSGKIVRAQFKKHYELAHYNKIIQQLDKHLRNQNTLPNWFYKEKLVQSEMDNHINSEVHKKSFIIFRGSKALDEKLQEKLIDSNSIYIDMGETFSKIDNHNYIVNPKNGIDYIKVFEEISPNTVEPLDILHLWNYNDNMGNVETVEDLVSSQYLGGFSIMFIVQGVLKANLNLTSFNMVTIDSIGVENKNKFNYQNSTIGEYVKTLGTEFENIVAKHIDLEGKELEFDSNAIVREVNNYSEDAPILYRNEKRFKVGLEKIDIIKNKENENPFKNEGFYIVTGGLGGIGTLVATLLLERYSAKVLLIGRTKLDLNENRNNSNLAHQRKIDEFNNLKEYEKHGGKLEYISCDICDVNNVRAIVKEYSESFDKELDGIIHLAGTIQEKVICEQTEEELHEMYKAKVYGTWVLNEIVKEHSNSIYVTTSSGRTLIPGMTIAAYCSANKFVEDFAYYQRYQDNVKSYCFSWSIWDETGMSADLANKSSLINKGFEAIDNVKGINSLLMGLKCDEPTIFIGLNSKKDGISKLLGEKDNESYQVTIYVTIKNILSQDINVVETIFNELNKKGFEEEPKKMIILYELPLDENGKVEKDILLNKANKALGTKGDVEPRNDVEEAIYSIWKHALKINNFSVFDNFFELGGDSLTAMQMISAVRTKFDVELTQQEFFDLDTFEEMAILVGDKLNSSKAEDSSFGGKMKKKIKLMSKLLRSKK